MLFVKLFHTQIRQMLSLQQHNKHAIKQHTVEDEFLVVVLIYAKQCGLDIRSR